MLNNLSTLAVVCSGGHVPNTLSGGSTAQLARPLHHIKIIIMNICNDDHDDPEKNLAGLVSH